MDNEAEKLFSGLRDRDYAREGLFVCEGRLVIEKALAAGVHITSLICVPADETMWRARSEAEKAGGNAFPVTVMDRPSMEKLVGFAFHRGAIALGDRPWPSNQPPKSGACPHALALWQVSDPDNLGALIRSAAALGATRVYLGPGCADHLGRKALRSSMGCALSVETVRVDSIAEIRQGLQAGGRIVAAALVPGALEPAEARARNGESIAVVLGNEGWGLPGEIVEACDAAVIIPMATGIDSLNVAAAGAILMWELFRKFDTAHLIHDD